MMRRHFLRCGFVVIGSNRYFSQDQNLVRRRIRIVQTETHILNFYTASEYEQVEGFKD
jgi:hypothetical protein